MRAPLLGVKLLHCLAQFLACLGLSVRIWFLSVKGRGAEGCHTNYRQQLRNVHTIYFYLRFSYKATSFLAHGLVKENSLRQMGGQG